MKTGEKYFLFLLIHLFFSHLHSNLKHSSFHSIFDYLTIFNWSGSLIKVQFMICRGKGTLKTIDTVDFKTWSFITLGVIYMLTTECHKTIQTLLFNVIWYYLSVLRSRLMNFSTRTVWFSFYWSLRNVFFRGKVSSQF